MHIKPFSMMPYDAMNISYSQAVYLKNLGEKNIVALGDSWFDYPPGADILSCLLLPKYKNTHKIERLGKHGDTLENMSYGTEVDGKYKRKNPKIEIAIMSIKKHKPKVFLLSAGGNDIAGEMLASFLNHKDSGVPVLRESYVDYMINEVFCNQYKYIVNRVWDANPNIHIITHGYGHALPSGIGVGKRITGFNFKGPWLKPFLVRKNITDSNEGKIIIKILMDKFNEMLRGLQDGFQNGHFHYLDLRSKIHEKDWANELHLKVKKYGEIAEVFHKKIVEVS